VLVPFWSIYQNTSTEHIFDDFIDSLRLSISLGVISWAADEMGAQTLMYLLPKMSNEDRSSIGDDGVQGAMIADDVGYVELSILSDPVCRGYRYEVGWLSQAVHDNPYQVIPTWGAM
jgi:hypothetical protein